MGIKRGIEIGRDAQGNAIISGDGNVVIFQTGALQEPEPEHTATGGNPYRGLEAFREEHAGRFYGREALVARLWEAFRRLHEAPTDGAAALRLLPILGPSGSGKSSLARAGLIAELARRPLPGRSEARVAIITPGARPLEALALVLARIATADDTPAAKTAEFAARLAETGTDGSADGLRFIADMLPEIATKPLIVLVDQFEEIYALARDATARDTFVATLLNAAADPGGRVSVLLTLRSDFLGAVNRHPALSQVVADSAVIVPVMNEDELRRAIAEPAAAAGHPIDAATIALLLEDAKGREGALPLLQFVLTRIWEGLGQGTIPADTVAALGGVGGALASEAQRLYDGLSDADRRIARRAFLTMVQLGEGARDTRRRAPVAEMVGYGDDPERVLAVLRVFTQPDKRLVTLSAEPDGPSAAEVTHEALFEYWETLRDWFDESREDVRFHRRLADQVADWDSDGRPEGMLWRRPTLDMLRAFHARASADMTEPQVAFLMACEHHDRLTRRLRFGAAAAFAMVLTVAAGLAVFLMQQFQFGEEQKALVEKLNTALVEADVQREIAEVEAALKEDALSVADEQRQVAEEQARIAADQRNQAVVQRSHFLTALARQEVEAGRPAIGVKLALEALPRELGHTDHMLLIEAELALYDALASNREQLALQGHDGSVFSAAFSSDGKRVVTASTDATARIWDATSGAELGVLGGHAGKGLRLLESVNAPSQPVVPNRTALAFSLEGTRLVIATGDGPAQLWDVDAGELLAALEGHVLLVNSTAFNQDGTRIVTGSDDKTARLWDGTSGAPLVALVGHGDWVSSALFSPDGSQVVTASGDWTARLWDVETGVQQSVLEGHVGPVNLAKFSPDGTRIVTASEDTTARLWDGTTGAALAVFEGHRDTVISVAFSPDGALVVTSSGDGRARIWDAVTGVRRSVLEGHSGPIYSAAFSPDGTRVVTGSQDNTVRLWDSATGAPLAVLKGHVDAIISVAFSSDGERVLTTSNDGTARLWDANRKRDIVFLEGHHGAVFSAAYSPDGARAVTASAGGTARLWDTETGLEIAALLDRERLSSPKYPFTGPSQIWSASFSADGHRVVTASADRTARLWNGQDGTLLAALRGHEAPVLSASFGPIDDKVATASADGTARLWDGASGTVQTVLEGHDGAVLAVDISPDGDRVVTASRDETARIWRTDTGAVVTVLRGHEDHALFAGFSPDGGRVLTASRDGTARLWDATTGESMAVLGRHAGSVFSAAFSPDGNRVVTVSEDRTARVWDSATGTPQAILEGHSDWVFSAAFSPDGSRIVTTSLDGTARLWDTESGTGLDILNIHQITHVRRRNNCLWDHKIAVRSAAFSPDGRQIVIASADSAAWLWNILPGGQALIDLARQQVPQELTAEERRRFFLDPVER